MNLLFLLLKKAIFPRLKKIKALINGGMEYAFIALYGLMLRYHINNTLGYADQFPLVVREGERLFAF